MRPSACASRYRAASPRLAAATMPFTLSAANVIRVAIAELIDDRILYTRLTLSIYILYRIASRVIAKHGRHISLPEKSFG
jgi:hypothetical protein